MSSPYRPFGPKMPMQPNALAAIAGQPMQPRSPYGPPMTNPGFKQQVGTPGNPFVTPARPQYMVPRAAPPANMGQRFGQSGMRDDQGMGYRGMMRPRFR